MLQWICYERCSTCRKAKKELDELGLEVTPLEVKKNPPDRDCLLALLQRMEQPDRLFNTSGQVYRQLGLAKTIKTLSLEEKADLLAAHGMLIKRPVLFDDEILIVGYRPGCYQSINHHE